MNKKSMVALAVTILGTLAASTNASASLCQALSTTFYTRQYCGLQARGYGEGITALGQKTLSANDGGNGASLVGAVGVNSSGGLLNHCAPYDTVVDGNPAYAVGGECTSAVKFYVPINYN